MKYQDKHKVKKELFVLDTQSGFKLELDHNKKIRISLTTFKDLTT